MPGTELSQRELAELIGRSVQQVGNLTRDGIFKRIPSATDPTKLVYPTLETLVAWATYLKNQTTTAEKRAKKSDKEKNARAREAIADAAMKEFRLGQMRGEWVKRADYDRELRKILGGIAQVLDVAPGKHAMRLPGEAPIAEKVAAIRAITRDVRLEMRRLGGPATDPEASAPAGAVA